MDPLELLLISEGHVVEAELLHEFHYAGTHVTSPHLYEPTLEARYEPEPTIFTPY